MNKFLIAITAVLLAFCVIAVVLFAAGTDFPAGTKKTRAAKAQNEQAKETEESSVTGEMVTIIGDSISFMTADMMRTKLPGVDVQAQNGKVADVDMEGNLSGLTIASLLNASGDLREIVVFALGSNNRAEVGTPPLTEDTYARLHEITGDRTVYLVTNYSIPQISGYDENNAAMAEAVRRYKNWHIIDWAGTVAALPDPLSALAETDAAVWGVRLHPSDPIGFELWTSLIAGNVDGREK